MRRALDTIGRSGTLLLGAALAVCSGCAALTVDVDMYKGPLSNHESLQARQINATIIGAKPILLSLRNYLERGDDPGQHERDWLAKQTRRESWTHYERSKRMGPAPGREPPDEKSRRKAADADAEKEIWQAFERRQEMLAYYASRFWPQPYDANEPWLGDARAIRVNAVLSLYRDDTSEELRPYESQIRTYMDQVERARSVLQPSTRHDRALWQSLGPHFFRDGDPLDQHPAVIYLRGRIEAFAQPATGNRPQTTSLEQANTEPEKLRQDVNEICYGYSFLRQGYHELLDPCSAGRRDRRLDTLVEGHRKICGVYERNPNLSRAAVPFPDVNMPDGANAQFQMLQDPNFVRAHLRFLSESRPADANEQKTVEAVNEIATSFLEARRALEGTLRVTLDLIEYLDTNRDRSVNERRYREATVRFALSLVKCTAVAAALANEHAPPAVDELRHRMAEASRQDITRVARWTDPTIRWWKNVLNSLFEEDPHATSRQLRAAHLSLMSGAYHVPEKGLYGRYNRSSMRMFGLTLAATQRRVEADWVEESRGDIDEAPGSWVQWNKSTTGAGLEHGRPAQGLETLIDTYLELTARAPSSGPQADGQQKQLEDTRSRLMDALVDFAEKILVIADYDKLLGDPKEKNDRKKAQKIRRYIDVLQSVGNSVIVQANELRTKAAHDDNLRAAGQRERLALKYALSAAGVGGSNPDGQACALPDGLIDPCDNCKEVLDGLITALRYEYALLLTKPGAQNSSGADNVARALAVLYEQRADMIYLRPSSAYLRSSYPATSLQANPSAAGRNMLLDHLTQPGPRTEELQMLWDNDKQFWQNVNRIRVVGSGKTNYAVVKDDIGNWYVKGYRNDPECIIQGARSAALFAGMSGGALSSIGKAAGVVQKAGSPLTPAKPTQIVQLDELDRAYRESLQSDLTRIADRVKDLGGSIKSRWNGDPLTRRDANDLWNEVRDSATELPETCARLANPGDGKSEADRFLEMIKAVQGFCDGADAGIARMTLKSPDTEKLSEPEKAAIKTAARKHLRTAVGSFLLPWVERRATAIQDYETVLLVLGNSRPEPAGPLSPPSPPTAPSPPTPSSPSSPSNALTSLNPPTPSNPPTLSGSTVTSNPLSPSD